MSLFKDWKGRASGGGSDEHQACSHGHGDECKVDPALEEDVYDGLDASVTLLIHGLESDWIEEEMSDDDDFKWDFKIWYFDEIFKLCILCKFDKMQTWHLKSEEI